MRKQVGQFAPAAAACEKTPDQRGPCGHIISAVVGDWKGSLQERWGLRLHPELVSDFRALQSAVQADRESSPALWGVPHKHAPPDRLIKDWFFRVFSAMIARGAHRSFSVELYAGF